MTESRKGQAPYGFRWKDGRLEAVAGEVQTRKLAFEHFVRLRSKGAVARKLNELGRPTRRAAGKWSDVQVARILNCSSAIGRYMTGGDADAGKPGNDSPFISCPAIIELPLWNQVRTILEQQADPSAATKRPKAERLFAGQVFCECGERMQLPDDGKKYGCPGCHRKIGLLELEAAFVEDLTDLGAGHPHFQPALAGRTLDLDLVAVERKLSEAVAEHARVEKLVVQGVISTKRYGTLGPELEARIDAAKKELNALRKRKAAAASEPATASVPFSERWKKLTPSARNRIARAWVRRLIVGADAVLIDYLITDPLLKDAPLAQQTSSPTNQAEPPTESDGVVYIRLPKAGKLCELTGLSRAKLNELILPNERNNFKAPVESKCLRGRPGGKGARLIDRDSLLAYVRAQHA